MSNQTIQNHDAARINATHSALVGQWRRAWNYYYGRHKKQLAVGKRQKRDFNLMINYVKLAIDVKTSFLFGEPSKSIEFTTDAGKQDDTPAELWLRNVWEYNRKLTKLRKLAVNGHICGTAYLMLKAPRLGQAFPEIIVLDPEFVKPEWDIDDIDRLDRVVIEYENARPDGTLWTDRKVIEQNPDGAGWVIIQMERSVDSEDDDFQQVGDVILWPYSWCPVHHCQNIPDPNVFFGLSDVERDLMDLNDAINFTVSNINKILFFHAHPKTWGKGVSAEQLTVNADGTILLNSKDGMLANLEMSGDLQSSLGFYETLRGAFKQMSSVPEVALGGIDDPARVSSLALKVLYGPLLMQTGQKRVTYGEMLEEVCRHLLEMGNPEWAGTRVSIEWPYVLPEDPETEARTLVLDQQLGLSKATAMQKRGYKATVEKENREDEAAENVSIGDQLLKDFDAGGFGPELDPDETVDGAE